MSGMWTLLVGAAVGLVVPSARSGPRPSSSATRSSVLPARRSINLLTGVSDLQCEQLVPTRRPNLQMLLIGAIGWGLSCHASAEDLLLACVSPQAFRMMVEWRSRAYGQEARLSALLELSRQRLLRNLGPGVGAHVTARTKGLWSTFHKSCVRKQTVHDTLAMRIVVDGDDDSSCLGALEAVQQLWPSVPGRFKDYILSPKPNGYRALHDTVLLPCGTPLEVQVRTRAMHRHAELGAAAHRNYKGPLGALPNMLLSGMTSLVVPPPRPIAARALTSRWPALVY